MWLSHNFHLVEFINSNEAVRRGIDNSPPPEDVDNMIALCENILEPVRAEFEAPVRISSGYRCPRLNMAIGGSASSQHCNGMAADFEIPDVDNCELAQWVADNLDFDQLILEFHNHDEGMNSGWVHASYNSAGNRRQILTASSIRGKTIYSNGFPWQN